MKLIETSLLPVAACVATFAMAGDIKPYSQQEFDRLTAGGKPVLLDINATWCPTCKQQKPIIASLMKQPAYKDITALTIDFDANKPTLKKFKVTSQSTLVAFKGAKEVGRSVGDINPDGIEGLFKKAVN